MFGPPFQRVFSFRVIRSAAIDPMIFAPKLPFPKGKERLSQAGSGFVPFPEARNQIARPLKLFGVSNQMERPLE